MADAHLTTAHRDLVLAAVEPPERALPALWRFLERAGESGEPRWHIPDADEVAREVFPSVWWNLGSSLDSDERFEPFRAAYRRNYVRNTLLIEGVGPLLDALARLDPEAVVLKGAAMLSDRYIGDLGFRTIGDVDVLVGRDSFTRVLEWCRANAWILDEDERWTLRQWVVAHHAVAMGRGDRAVADIHHDLLAGDRSPALDRRLRARAECGLLDSRAVLVPDPTDQMLHTLAHWCEIGPRPMIDAVLLARRHSREIDWDRLVDEVVERRQVSQTMRTLTALIDVAPDAVPQYQLDRLRSIRPHPFDGPDRVARRKGGAREVVQRFVVNVAQRSRHEGPMRKARIASVVARSFIQAGRHHLGTTVQPGSVGSSKPDQLAGVSPPSGADGGRP